MNQGELLTRAAAVVDPNLGGPLGAAVERAELDGDDAVIHVTLGFPIGGYEPSLTALLRRELAAGGWRGGVRVQLRAEIAAHAVQGGLRPLATIRNVMAVASAKGGVGKSTTTANLAIALAAQGARVGLLDADIYGPSQPLMMGLAGERPITADGKRLEPLRAYGVEVMSIGFLIDPEQPMVWRGPMVTQALQQLLGETHWGELDYLLVDMPPGTGDIQLTLAQRVPVSGAIIVTTPQDIALADARKGLMMFRKVQVPVLGIVENMAVHVCSNCGHAEHIFGEGGGARMAEQYGIPLLGSLPLDVHIREQADGGKPSVAADPDGPVARAYHEIARKAAARLGAAGSAAAFPTISVSED